MKNGIEKTEKIKEEKNEKCMKKNCKEKEKLLGKK